MKNRLCVCVWNRVQYIERWQEVIWVAVDQSITTVPLPRFVPRPTDFSPAFPSSSALSLPMKQLTDLVFLLISAIFSSPQNKAFDLWRRIILLELMGPERNLP